MFDYEAFENAEKRHEANLVFAEKVCADCLDSDNRCHENCCIVQFPDNNSFCYWLFQQEHCIALAHNLKGYDGCFVLQYILRNTTSFDAKHKVLTIGTKILSIEFRKVKLIDSYSFLPVSLSKLPKMFGLPEQKGYFPHHFNKPENYNYIGPYPDKKYYGSEFFSCQAKSDFDEWYKEASKCIFNFKEQFESYCKNDVKLLSSGVLAFRKTIMQMTKKNDNDPGVDPFQTCITLASLCHHIYRRNMMKPNSIRITPENGFNPNKNTSKKCQLWLKYLSETNNIRIKHANNGGEYYIGPYYLDGICFENKTIYEFNGCIFHGCPRCFKSNTFNKLLQLTMGTLYVRNTKRIEYIKNNMPEYNIVQMWECDWDNLVKNNTDIGNYIRKNVEISEPLRPRDALYGGRTNAIVLNYVCKPGEKIVYQDYTSLYPDVQKNGVYPAGNLSVITENFKKPEDYFGLIRCKILPPRNLYLPVLPARVNGKLVFTLCAKCACEQNQSLQRCKHSDEERCLVGVWVTLEVNKAIEMGYRVIKIYEVWHYDDKFQNDPQTKQGGLFTDYVNKFIKFKTEASGYPKHIRTEEQKKSFIEEYFLKEGIRLDPEKMKNNPGLRTVSKFLCNAFWGRYALNSNKVKYTTITDPLEWIDMITDDRYVIHNIDFSFENILQVYYSINSDLMESNFDCSIPIAAFVTCQARLKLYNELLKIGKRVLYFDTDSIISISREGEYTPTLGDYLGEFTNEIDPSEGDYIVEFVSAGPKNYAYKLNTGVTHCVVKGFNLNFIASTKIHFDSIKEIVCDESHRLFKTICVDQLKFTRSKYTWEIETNIISKKYKFVYDKRVLLPDLTTLPYGF